MMRKTPTGFDPDQSIRGIVKKNLVGVNKNDTVQEAARKMADLDISSLVVLDGDNIVGFFTDSDINRKVVAKGLGPDTKVEEIMTSDLITIDMGTSVVDAIDIMTNRRVKHLLVTEREKVVAVLTSGDLFGFERQMIGTHISRD